MPFDDSAARAVHIDLDLALRGDELRGRAAVDGLAERDFTGWAGLIAVLDALIEPPDEPPRQRQDEPAREITW